MIQNKIVYTEYCDYRIKLSKAEGSHIWNENGKQYIDFTSSWNVTNLGWNHPEVAAAMIEQIQKNATAPLWGCDPIQELYAEKLTAALPQELDTCIKCNSGTEAVEMAIKVARAATGRKKIVGFKNTYHGQLFASMALGFSPASAEAIAPLVPEFIQLDYPHDTGASGILEKFSAELEAILAKNDVAAVVTEPGMVTGWGSMQIAPTGYLTTIRTLTAKYETLLIVDEVATGFSRMGTLFGIEQENVVPDFICLAKGIANGGAPIGAVVGKKAIIEPAIPPTNLTSTFGWSPVACAAALKTLEVHQREKVWEQAKTKGDYLLAKLKSGLANNPSIVDIRGKGMEIGIEIKKDAERYAKVFAVAADAGLHLVGDTESLIQLMPPLTISQEDLDTGADILIQALAV